MDAWNDWIVTVIVMYKKLQMETMLISDVVLCVIDVSQWPCEWRVMGDGLMDVSVLRPLRAPRTRRALATGTRRFSGTADTKNTAIHSASTSNCWPAEPSRMQPLDLAHRCSSQKTTHLGTTLGRVTRSEPRVPASLARLLESCFNSTRRSQPMKPSRRCTQHSPAWVQTTINHNRLCTRADATWHARYQTLVTIAWGLKRKRTNEYIEGR
jgi:hypothetical protein